MNATLSSRVVYIPLSKLVPSKRNPRRVKPDRDAHRRKVASIRALGLIQPLVVRPDDNGNAGCYRVIAGNGRLAALREIYRYAKKAPKVACVLRRVDGVARDDTDHDHAGAGGEGRVRGDGGEEGEGGMRENPKSEARNPKQILNSKGGGII